MFIPPSCLRTIRIISALTTQQEHRRLVRGCESYSKLTLTRLTPGVIPFGTFHPMVRGTTAVESVQDAAPSMVSTIQSPGEGGLL